ncbi:MAG TPA: hypothetical protein VG406_29785 [Isosphaeraceae bacterium]|nr:hypothetical protein [Isosphaeraceae bacterium]
MSVWSNPRLARGIRWAIASTLFVVATSGQAIAHGPGPLSTPEIDPGAAGGAATLLFGGIALLTARRRRGR